MEELKVSSAKTHENGFHEISVGAVPDRFRGLDTLGAVGSTWDNPQGPHPLTLSGLKVRLRGLQGHRG